MKLNRIFLSFLLVLGLVSFNAHAANKTNKKKGAYDWKAKMAVQDARKDGNMLYISGILGINPASKSKHPMLVEGGVAPETQQIMRNIEKILKKNGTSFNRVLKCTILVVDMREMPVVNSIYGAYFRKGFYPARSFFEVGQLYKDARVEISCVARIPSAKKK